MATVSAVIPTFNRAPQLQHSLSELLRQSRRPDEILIIDDASTDDTETVVKAVSPTAKYLRTSTRSGPSHARNLGITAATGDLILHLDDDSWFTQRDGLAQAVACIERHPTAAAVALNVITPQGPPWLPLDSKPAHIATFVACAALIRRTALLRAGLYCEVLNLMGEEEDLSIRLYDVGYHILALPDVTIYHAQSAANRNWARVRYLSHRNRVFSELLRCPGRALVAGVARTWFANTLYNLRQGYWTTDLKVLCALPTMLTVAAKQRTSVRCVTYRLWRELKHRNRISGKLTYALRRLALHHQDASRPRIRGRTIVLALTSGHRLVLRRGTTDLLVFQECFIERSYFKALQALKIRCRRQRPLRILDLGANVGVAALVFAESFPDAEIVCVEPEPNNFTLLTRNARRLRGSVKVVQAFAGDRCGAAYVEDAGRGEWGFRMSSRPRPGQSAVPVYDIVSLMRMHGWDYIDLLKVDIEGTEFPVFKDCQKWLQYVGNIIVETDGDRERLVGMVLSASSAWTLAYREDRGGTCVFGLQGLVLPSVSKQCERAR